MKLAATCVLLAASLTAVVRHHERPESSSATLVDRPLPARASRGLQRHPLSGRVNTALASVKARRRLTHGPRHVATSHETGSHPVVLRDQTVWDRLAECESSGDWHINTGNGYFGGLQFAQSTWMSFGGGRYAPRADLASKVQQIVVAQRVLVSQGWDAWPSCSRQIGVA